MNLLFFQIIFLSFLTDGSFNEEVYEISGVKTNLDVPLFKLKTLTGEELLGHYYTHELSRIRGDPSYRIESVLDNKGNKSLVKFVGFKKPEWVLTRKLKRKWKTTKNELCLTLVLEIF